MKRFFSMGFALLSCGAVFAQYTNVLENGAVQTVDSVWRTDSVRVGDATPGNALYIENGGAVVATNAHVGANPGASNNLVSVSGTGRWDIESTLQIGSGTGNSVSVGSGGTIAVGNLSIDAGNDFNLNAGGTLAVATGFDASTNGFNWNEGAHLSVGGNLTGMATTNGMAYLDGERDLTLNGGTWDAGLDNLVVGYGGSGGDLVVSNGAWANVGTGTTNDFPLDSAGGITVGGTNGATMSVDNGSTVQTTGGLYIGGTNAALSGSVAVANGGVVQVHSLDVGNDSSLDIENGGTLAVSGFYNADTQTNVNWKSGGTLAISGTLTKSNGLDGVGRTLEIDGGNWDPTGDLTVSGSGNTLAIAEGGAVANDDGYVGRVAADSNNTVSVSGSGSVWQNTGTLYIGSTDGSGNNSVVVSDGGRVEAEGLSVANGNGFNLGDGGTLAITTNFNVSACDNFSWDSGGTLSVGGELSGMATTNLLTGNGEESFTYLDGEHGLVLDAGTWDATGTNLIAGYESSNNRLVVSNGATVANADGYIGWGSGSANNSVLVTGPDSKWTNSGGDLHVGLFWSGTNLVRAGSNNSLAVEDNAWVVVGDAQTNLAGGGILVASTNGAQLLVGNGSVEVEGTLYIGLDADTTGTNTIQSGGSVSASDLDIAEGSLLDLLAGGTFSVATNFDASTNGFNWNEGAHLSVGGNLTGMATTNGMAYLDGERDLTLNGGTWDAGLDNLVVGYGDAFTELVVTNGGSLANATGYIGWDANSTENTVEVRDGGTWDNSADLRVGYGGDGNALLIGEDGTVTVGGSAYIGNTNVSGNLVQVAGSNATWSVGGDLMVGLGANSQGNALEIGADGTVDVEGDLMLASGNSLTMSTNGTLEVGGMSVQNNAAVLGAGTIEFGDADSVLALSGSVSIANGIVFDGGDGANDRVEISDSAFVVLGSNTQQYVNFETLALTDSDLVGYGVNDFANIAMTRGTIDPVGTNSATARLEISGAFSASGTVYRAQVYETGHDELVFTGAGAVNLSELELEVEVLSAPTNLAATVLSASGGLAGDFAATSVVERLLLYDAELSVAGNDADIVLVETTDNLGGSALAFASTESVRAGFDGMKNSVFSRTKQLRRNFVATEHSISQEAYLLSNTNAPSGPMGPGDANTIFDMHVWMQHYNGQGDFDAMGASDGFSLNNNGMTIGFDRFVGEDLTLGFNYTYARSAARTTGSDHLDSEIYWLGAYGEWVGKQGLYVNALAAYGRSNFDSLRIEDNYAGTASYRGQAFGAYADVGQYFHAGNLALSPYLGLHALTLVNEAHNETETSGGSSVRVDEVSRTTFESALGLKLRHRFDTGIGRFQTTGFAEWAHDFVEDDIESSLGSPLLTKDLARISPDADVLNGGLGLSLICTDYMEIGIGYNGRFSENSEEHTGSLMLDVMF